MPHEHCDSRPTFKYEDICAGIQEGCIVRPDLLLGCVDRKHLVLPELPHPKLEKFHKNIAQLFLVAHVILDESSRDKLLELGVDVN